MFKISEETKRRLIAQDIRPEELILQQSVTVMGRIWELKTAEEQKSQSIITTTEVFARGKELGAVFQKVANGEELEHKYQELGRIRAFRYLTRRIPGMETVEHRAKVQASIRVKMKRVKETLKKMGQGVAKLKVADKSWRIMDSEYALTEIVLKKQTLPVYLVNTLATIWRGSHTSLDFNSWVQMMEDEGKTGKTGVWLLATEEALMRVWRSSRISMSFDEWKLSQTADSLDSKLAGIDKRDYHVDCVEGQLIREKGRLFSTPEETTLHSGIGWSIFIISPEQKLYCASHSHHVFHHSSFLNCGAVMAAGEIKTDRLGKITHISSKSGHYKPTSKENYNMLLWFQARGTDLKEVQFTCFLPDGKPSVPLNAEEYLQTVKERAHIPSRVTPEEYLHILQSSRNSYSVSSIIKPSGLYM